VSADCKVYIQKNKQISYPSKQGGAVFWPIAFPRVGQKDGAGTEAQEDTLLWLSEKDWGLCEPRRTLWQQLPDPLSTGSVQVSKSPAHTLWLHQHSYTLLPLLWPTSPKTFLYTSNWVGGLNVSSLGIACQTHKAVPLVCRLPGTPLIDWILSWLIIYSDNFKHNLWIIIQFGWVRLKMDFFDHPFVK
jgi:hypothetical protein